MRISLLDLCLEPEEMSARNTFAAKAIRRVERVARHQRRAKIQKDQLVARVAALETDIIGFYKTEKGTWKYGQHKK